MQWASMITKTRRHESLGLRAPDRLGARHGWVLKGQGRYAGRYFPAHPSATPALFPLAPLASGGGAPFLHSSRPG